jgi:hypothetical protein
LVGVIVDGSHCGRFGLMKVECGKLGEREGEVTRNEQKTLNQFNVMLGHAVDDSEAISRPSRGKVYGP